jgi:folate-dependent phosphoribosylglycinamide formyltransferase PurN
MGYEKEAEPTLVGQKIHMVEATSDNGSVVSRDAFTTRAESDGHAEKLRAQGFKVTQTTVEPAAR